MVQLRQPDFGRVRRLASSLSTSTLPSVRRLGQDFEDYLPSSRDIAQMVEESFLDYGWDPNLPTAAIELGEDDRNKGQKQLDTLRQRLEVSGQEVPDPQDAGRQGIVGWLLNALGAPGGAVTTLVHDIIDGEEFTPLQSLRRGWTGEDRKIGSDILEQLGVQNKVARGVGGFALDVALDPLSYTGVGLARNIASAATRRTAREALERAGQRATDEELNSILQKAAGPSSGTRRRVTTDPRVATVAQALGRPVREVPYGDGRKAYELSDIAPTFPRQINLEVGIPFTSRQLPIADLTPAARRVGDSIRQLPDASGVIRATARTAERARRYVRNTFSAFPIPENVANMVRQRGWRAQSAGRKAAQLGEKLDRAIGGGVDTFPEIHKAIARSLDDPNASKSLIDELQLPDNQRKTVENVLEEARKEFDEIAKREAALGILSQDQVRPFYFTHLLDGDRQALELAKQQYLGGSTASIRTQGPYQRARTTDTLDELEDFVQRFNAANPTLGDIRVNYDVGQVLATRKLASETMIQNAKIVDDLINLGPDYVRPLKDGRNIHPGFTQIRGLNSKLDDYVIQEDVAKFLQEWFSLSRTGDTLNEFVRVWDSILETWKGLVTATPGFHIRNFLGAVWNNWIMGTRDPRVYADAIDMIARGGIRRASPNLDVLREKRITLPDGRTLNGEEILHLADHFGVLHVGWRGDTRGRSIRDIGRQRGVRDVVTLDHSRRLGETVDDAARLAGFMDQLQKTGDPFSSALNVKKHLFDYNELSRTEKQLFRRIVPFYTWTRKNIPLQLEALMTRPGMYTGLVHAQDEGAAATGIEIEQMPEWLANTAMVPLRSDEQGITNYINQYALPANDIFELLRGLSSPGEALRYVGQQIAPGIRASAEIPLNRQFFSGAPIDYDADTSGEQPGSAALLNYIFQQSGLPYNLYRSITGERELVSTRGADEEPRGDDEFTARNLPPFDPRQPLGFLGMFGEYNPEYWQEEVLPYRYGQQLRGEIRRLTNQGETVYTKTEIDQAEELGLDPEQVRILRNMLDEMGERKTKKNLTELYYSTQ